jgi:hypothetical protein
MENQINYLQKYSLADIFDKTIKMMKHTWKDSLFLSAIGFIPYAIALGVAMFFYIDALIKILTSREFMSQGGANFQWQALTPLFISLGLIFLAVIVYSIAAILISGYLSLKTYKKAHGQEVSLKENLLYILKNKFGKLILLELLFMAIFIGLYLAFFIAIFILALVSLVIMQSNSLYLAFVILLTIILFAVSIWLSIALSFATQALVIDDTKVTQALVKSFNLVKGNWWRVLGYNLLLGIVISFGISLVTSPVLIAFLLPIYIRIFESMMQKGTFDFDMASIMEALRMIYLPLTIISFLQAIGYMLITPVFKTLFYIDLKFRKGELNS